MKHLLTFDVEEWYDGLPINGEMFASRLEMQMERVLSLLAETGQTATFFWLGSRAEAHRDLIEQCVIEGHEIACHGWNHDFLYKLPPVQLREQLKRAKSTLEEITGTRVNGFRAPYFSINSRSFWILDTLAELGFHYDSSIHPISYWRYGVPGFSTLPTDITTPFGSLLEIPISTHQLGSVNIPFAGGAYFRLLPIDVICNLFEAKQSRGEQVMFYLHPWEFDPRHPKVFIPSSVQLSHYYGLASAEDKLRKLLAKFEFASIQTAGVRVYRHDAAEKLTLVKAS